MGPALAFEGTPAVHGVRPNLADFPPSAFRVIDDNSQVVLSYVSGW